VDIRYQNTLGTNHTADGDAVAAAVVVVGSLPEPAKGSLRDDDDEDDDD